MELSQYVIDAIAKAERYEWRHNFDVSQSLKVAATEAKDATDTYVLNILSGVLSMLYVDSEQTFSPLVVFADGHRPFAIEDIKSDDYVILKAVIDITKSTWIRAHLAHIMWLLSKDYKFGRIAVSAYVELFLETISPREWTTCYDAIKAADSIACNLGKSSESYKQVYDSVMNSLIGLDGTDPLYLSLKLIRLIIKNADKKDLIALLQIVDKLADKNISQDNKDFELARETHDVYVLVLNRMGKQSEIKKVNVRLAEYYAVYAERLSNEEDDFRAISLLKRACTLYSRIDQERLLELRNRLEVLQGRSLQKMQTISIPIDISGIIESIDTLFNGLTTQQAILQISRIARIYKVEDIKKEVLKKQKELLHVSLFGSTLLNERGQAVQELPPLDIRAPESDPDLLFKHMVNHVSKIRDHDSTILEMVFRHIPNIQPCKRDDLNSLIDNNVIIPDNRAGVIREGLFLGLTGKQYAAAHILLPQTENIFRNLVKLCGDTVTFLKDDGTEDIKPLSKLFSSVALNDCYSEDVIFTFQSIMTDPAGENLRNLVAHGQLEPTIANGRKCLHFLCLLIKLLSWYSPASQPILKSLIEQDQKQVS